MSSSPLQSILLTSSDSDRSRIFFTVGFRTSFTQVSTSRIPMSDPFLAGRTGDSDSTGSEGTIGRNGHWNYIYSRRRDSGRRSARRSIRFGRRDSGRRNGFDRVGFADRIQTVENRRAGDSGPRGMVSPIHIGRSNPRTGTYGGARIRSYESNRRLRGKSDLDLVRIAIARTPVRFQRDDSEEARDSDGRFRMRSDDWIRPRRIQTGEAEEILDSGFPETSEDVAEGVAHPPFG